MSECKPPPGSCGDTRYAPACLPGVHPGRPHHALGPSGTCYATSSSHYEQTVKPCAAPRVHRYTMSKQSGPASASTACSAMGTLAHYEQTVIVRPCAAPRVHRYTMSVIVIVIVTGLHSRLNSTHDRLTERLTRVQEM